MRPPTPPICKVRFSFLRICFPILFAIASVRQDQLQFLGRASPFHGCFIHFAFGLVKTDLQRIRASARRQWFCFVFVLTVLNDGGDVGPLAGQASPMQARPIW